MIQKTLVNFKYINGPRNGLSHQQREDRRQEISIYYSHNSDLSFEQIAETFNVGVATVKAAIKEFQIDPLPVFKQLQFDWPEISSKANSQQTMSDRQLFFAWYCCDQFPEKSLNIVYDLLDQYTREVDLADKYHVSRQRINQIKLSAIEKGVVFPERYRPLKICVICRVEHDGYTQTCSKKCLSKLLRQRWLDKAEREDPKWSRLIHHTYECLGCGSEFERSNYMVSIAQASGVSNPKYCSKECYQLYGNGKSTTQGQDTESISENTSSVCQLCDSAMDHADNIGICKSCLEIINEQL